MWITVYHTFYTTHKLLVAHANTVHWRIKEGSNQLIIRGCQHRSGTAIMERSRGYMRNLYNAPCVLTWHT
jgi:hypothetical protein